MRLFHGLAFALITGGCSGFSWVGGGAYYGCSPNVWGVRVGRSRRQAPVCSASTTSEGTEKPKYITGVARPITEKDFAQNYQPIDRSGNPEKRAEIEEALPGVDIDKLCKEVPEVLLWSKEGLAARLDVLRRAMPNYDLSAVLSESPTILEGAPYLNESLKQLEEWFPGQALVDLMPRYMPSDIGSCPRAVEYPGRLEHELPYLDPGLMGNYSVRADLIDAMRKSQHMVFGLWKEDVEALERFVSALRRATLAFETRVQFLREHYGDHQFQRYYADDLYGETVGHVEEWVKKHPEYDGYMEEKLVGYQDMDYFTIRRAPLLEKETMMCTARNEGYFDISEVEAGAEEENDGWDDEGVEEEEDEADDDFFAAMEQALWTFQVRTGFLEVLYGTEKYRDEVMRRVRRETAGTAEEFLVRYTTYEEYLHSALNGWEGKSIEEWAEVGIDEKEDEMVMVLRHRGRFLVEAQKEASANPAPYIPDVMHERATESREEVKRALEEEELAKLDAMDDEQVRRHLEAYEEYLRSRFPAEFEPPLDAINDLA